MTTVNELIEKRKIFWEYKHDILEDKKLTDDITDLIFSDNKLMLELMEKPELLIPLQFIIVDKERNTIPFFPNDVQCFVLDIIRKGINDFKLHKRSSLKFRCLKGRQEGVTAIITALQLACTLLSPNFSGYTMADKGENAKVILNDKGKYAYHNLADKFKPHEKFNSANEIFFDKLNSSWRTASAESTESGRSRTINFLHFSESAFFPNMLKTMAALDPTLTKNAIIFEETTGNGFNSFRENWYDKDSEFENIFIPWWWAKEYSIEFESEEIGVEFKTNVDNQISKFFKKLYFLKTVEKLNYNQLYFYFKKRKTLKGLLEQEYPCSAEEAFLFSGRTYFDKELVENKIIELKKVKIVEKRLGDAYVIFEAPQEGEKYYIGVDVAEGIESGDASHAKIIKASTCEEVGFVHGHFSPDRFGDILVDIAVEYNKAFLGIEANNHGHSVIATVYRYRNYKNIYISHQHGRVFDKKDTSKKLGWTTTESSKYLMLDELDSALRDDIIHFKDVKFFKEAHKVTVDEKGKVALTGKDRVVAAGIAYQMRKYYGKMNAVAEYYASQASEQKEKELMVANSDVLMHTDISGGGEDSKVNVVKFERPYRG